MKVIDIGKHVTVLSSQHSDIKRGDVGIIRQHLRKHYGYGVEFTKPFQVMENGVLILRPQTRIVFIKHGDLKIVCPKE